MFTKAFYDGLRGAGCGKWGWPVVWREEVRARIEAHLLVAGFRNYACWTRGDMR